MERGVRVGSALKSLAKERGFSQPKLEAATGIGHSTMSGYWSGRLGLGLKNGRKIADALGVEISALGLSEAEEAASAETDLRLAHAALEETVRLLAERVEALERSPAAPRRVAGAPKRKAGER